MLDKPKPINGKPKLREQNLQRKILEYLKSKGAYAVKTIVTNRNGVPDILFCYKGDFIAFECKSEHGEITMLQEYNIRSIEKAGGKAYCVRSMEEVKQIVEYKQGGNNA
mgnify:CR=1 FL=1